MTSMHEGQGGLGARGLRGMMFLLGLTLCQIGLPRSVSETCARLRALALGEARRSQTPEIYFQAWVDANLVIPQSGFASTIALANQMLQAREPLPAILESRLTSGQLRGLRAKVRKVHRAFRITPRSLAIKAVLSFGPLLNYRLQHLWTSIANNSTGVLGALMAEIDKGQTRLLTSDLREELTWDVPHVRAAALEKVLGDPRFLALVSKTTSVVALFDRALRDPEFRRAAAVYRNSMRPNGRRESVWDLVDKFADSAIRVFHASPIEGLTEDEVRDLVRTVAFRAG